VDGILPSADPKIEDQPFMSRKASGPRQMRHFSKQACLADPRVATNVDQPPLAGRETRGEDAPKLLELGAAADKPFLDFALFGGEAT